MTEESTETAAAPDGPPTDKSLAKRNRTPNPLDQVWLFRQLLRHAIALDDEFVEVPIVLARAILDLAVRAPHPSRGRRRLSGRTRIGDALIIFRAKRRKEKLLTDAKVKRERLSADEAALQAAKETKEETKSRPSVEKIRERMDRRKNPTKI
jgi:hypothetical protein